MKKLKTQKGITLIALIITIVVLLILAVVAIGAVQDSNIVGYAQNAAGGYDKAKVEENYTLSGYEAVLNQYANGNSVENNNGSNNQESSGDNNGGTNDNTGEENNGENTEGGDEEPEETPPAVIYYSKTLNTNMNDYVDALALTDSLIGWNKKITYVSGSNKLKVELVPGTTVQSFSVIYVTYTDAQGSVYKYAISNPKNPWTLEQFKNSMPYNFIPSGSWTKPSGETYTANENGAQGVTADIYAPISQIPVFEGQWQIDEANTTQEGLTYLSNVLIDVIN